MKQVKKVTLIDTLFNIDTYVTIVVVETSYSSGVSEDRVVYKGSNVDFLKKPYEDAPEADWFVDSITTQYVRHDNGDIEVEFIIEVVAP